MPPPRHAGFVELLGLEESAGPPGTYVCALTVDARHQNIQGVIHGSVLMALLDTAMGHALSAGLRPDEFCSTTQWSVQFLKASRPGDRLIATGRVVQKGNRIAFLEGVCRNAAGDEVARAHGTWYVGRLDAARAPGAAGAPPTAGTPPAGPRGGGPTAS
ncbi:MAG: PaaI family thioesterase [Planctomycetia bacterium]|nr:PaaI family thioesterase [Planctomycetia bacterium]